MKRKEKLGNKLRSEWRDLGMLGRVIMVRKMRNKLGKNGKTGEEDMK